MAITKIKSNLLFSESLVSALIKEFFLGSQTLFSIQGLQDRWEVLAYPYPIGEFGRTRAWILNTTGNLALPRRARLC